jgi:formate hydrogenlyase transcriptional activator
MKSELPENEAGRLVALRRYQILDTPPDGAFDHIAAMAGIFFRVPIAIVSLVDEDRIWFKSHYGIEVNQVGRDPGLCASAILSPEVYHLRDALHDVRAMTNPLVAGSLGLRFYAAAPLRSHDGFNLGTLCIVDRNPRDLASDEAEMLTKMAGLVMDQMELRLAARKIAELQEAERTISDQLRQANQQLAKSEQRFRDLFDEAPIAYVYEDVDSRIIQANRTAMRILGLKPEDIGRFMAKSLVPDIPDAHRRLAEALERSDVADTGGVAFELRRKDDSTPLWVDWWSRPEPGGKFRRTMFIDITDRVLMEQEKARLEAHNAYLLDEIRTEQNFGDMVGESSGLRKVMQQVQLVAPTDATVLITGESGTGKELIARAIHEKSARSERPMVKLNCSAVPEGLFESEFFGHVKGAFTGALKDKPGRFELADGGTLFLDEIGEVPLAMQAKLLRVLQEQELERVGDTRTRKVNVRVIAASNRDLKKEVDEGHFRQDLFYRLSVFPIQVPPLRERREDIGPMVAHFLRHSVRRMNRPEPQVSKAALNQLAAYHWPGNVRELQNTVERAIILWREGPLTFDLPGSPPPENSGQQPKAALDAGLLTRNEFKSQEREAIINALKRTNGKVSGPGGAAELLGMKPSTLASRISSLGINRRTLS